MPITDPEKNSLRRLPSTIGALFLASALSLCCAATLAAAAEIKILTTGAPEQVVFAVAEA